MNGSPGDVGVLENCDSTGAQHFLRSWFLKHNVAYRCLKKYNARKRFFKCFLISHNAFHVAVGKSSDWKSAKKMAALRYSAFLMSIKSFSPDEMPPRLRSICMRLMHMHMTKTQNSRRCKVFLEEPMSCEDTLAISEQDDQECAEAIVPQDDFLAKNILSNGDEAAFSLASDSAPPCREDSKLTRQICKFYDKHVQTQSVLVEKMNAVAALQAFVKQCDDRGMMDLFIVGSSVSGLGMNGCDIDLCLKYNAANESEETDVRRAALQTLRKLSRKLRRQSSPLQRVQLIPAKVPIVRCTFATPWNFEADINCNNTISVYNSHLLHYYAQVDRRFPIMAIFIKRWARELGICNAQLGFLNSYSWVLLVLNFLQCGTYPEPPVLPSLQSLYGDYFSLDRPLEELELWQKLPKANWPTNEQSVGDLIVSFFSYYASMNFSKTAISVRCAKTWPRKWNSEYIFIEEPYERLNTARALKIQWKYLKICSHLKHAHHRLKENANMKALFRS